MKNYLNPIKKILTMIVGGAAYAILFYHLFTRENIKTIHLISQTKINFINLFLIAFVWFFYTVSQGLYLKKVFQRWKISVSILNAIKIWLAAVAIGLVTFGVGGIAVIFYESKNLFKRQNSGNKLPAKLVLSYYIGYVSAILLFIIFSLVFIIPDFYLKIAIFLIVLFVVVLFLIWQKLKWLALFYALPVIIMNFMLFVLSFHLIDLHPHLLDYLKTYNLNIILNVFSPSSGGLGFVEIGLLKYLEYIGFSVMQASLVTILYRLISLWFTAFIGYMIVISLGITKVKS